MPVGGTVSGRGNEMSATAKWVVALCWIAILIEGFDVPGAVMTALFSSV